MFLDCFQLSLEKAWLTNFLKLSVDKPNQLISSWRCETWPWNLFEQQLFPLFFLSTVFGLILNFNWANPSFLHSYIIGQSCMPLKLLFPVVYAAISISGSQNGDNFGVMDHVFIGPFWHHQHQPIFVGVGGWKSQNNGLVTGAIIFLLPHLALCAKCCICLGWLIKLLLCRLYNNVICGK